MEVRNWLVVDRLNYRSLCLGAVTKSPGRHWLPHSIRCSQKSSFAETDVVM